jgi:hypothetical protein
MVVDGPNSSSLSFGDWSNTPTHSAIEGNMGYLLLGKNALDNFNIYLRSNNSVGGVYIGGNNTNTMAVSSSGMTLAGTAIFSGSTSTDLFKITQTGTGNAFVIEDEASDTTPFVISSAGNLRLGGGTSYGTYFYTGTGFNSNPKILAHTFDLFSAGLGAYTWNNGNNGVYTVYSKSRGATIGDMTIVQAGDGLSAMVFGGSDGEKFGEAARISVNVDGTPGLNSMPGLIAFSTTTTGTISPSERMRINAVGNVGIGTTAPAARLEVNGSTTIDTQANVAAEFGTSGGTNSLLVGSVTGNTPFIGSQGASNLLLNTNGVTRVHISSTGNVGIGTSTGGTMLRVQNDTAGNATLLLKNAASQSGLIISALDSADAQVFGVGSTGNVGIGSVTSASAIIRINKSITGSTIPIAYYLTSTVDANFSGITAAYGSLSGIGATASTAGTPLANLYHNYIGQGTFTNTTVAAQYGYYVDSSFIGATTNIGFRGQIPIGGSRWNLFMDGTAQNYLAGNTGIGITVPTSKLHVVGSFSRGAPVTKTASFTLADTENWIICNGTASITVTLPAASSQVGREITIKNVAAFTVVSASANIVPITGTTAAAAILPATVGAWVRLVSDGANWQTMQS